MLDASITAIGGNVLWLDAADQNTLIDNDGDNVSSGNFNGQIAQWNDKSGNGNNLSHGTAARQPTYTAAGKNGHDLVSFDGGDALYITDVAQSGLDLNGNGMTLIGVFNPTTVGGARILINKESSYEFAFQGGRNQAAISTVAPGGWAWGGTSAVATGWNVTGFEYDDTTWEFYQDGALLEEIPPANNQTGNIIPSNNIFTVGARGGGAPASSWFLGDMAELIVFDRALSDNERLDIEIYLADKWDMNLNNAAPVVEKSAIDLAQGASITISENMLLATDVDGPDTNLVYTLSSLASNGILRLNGVDLNVNDTFTQQDVVDGDLNFVHDGSAVAGDFDFTLTDKINTLPLANFTFSLNLKENTNNPVTLNEGGTVMVTTADLEFDNPDNWYDTDWQYRQKITIDSAHVGEDLTDFTVLLTEDNMSAAFWADVKVDGSDILLTSSDSLTKFSRELVSIDTVAHEMELHVKLSDIDSVNDTNFYLYFGNAAAAEVNDAATWNADYAGVWHLNEAAGNAVDATGNGNSGTMVNGTAQGIAGAIGKGVDLDGTNDYINATLAKGATATFSFWATWDGGVNDMLFLAGNYGSGPDLFFVPGGNAISWNTWNGSSNSFGGIPADAADGNFHHYELVVAPGVGNTALYYDGALLGTATYRDASATNVFQIGGGDPNYTWGGAIDEVRVTNAAFSADWIAAEYANQSDPSTFYSVGAVQSGLQPLIYTLDSVMDNGALKLGGAVLAATDTFTQADIDGGLMSYVHDDSNTTTDLFRFSVSDGFGNVTNIRDFNFNINLVNDEANHIPAEDGGGGDSVQVDDSESLDLHYDSDEKSILQTYELIRSTFSDEMLFDFYGEDMPEIIREGATMQIHEALDEMNESDHQTGGDSALLPSGTPQIMRAFEGQIEGALFFGQNRFNANIAQFLSNIT